MRCPPADPATERLHQIDGLRFIAILMVMLHHYLPQSNFPLFGHGVTLFFVLSGFFATRQLARARRKIEAGQISTPAAIWRFHVRRYLRIFPIYYCVVIGAILVDLPHARSGMWWHLTFTSNWHILRQLDWNGPFSPFWSLAVLEQFYLFWPTLLLTLPRRAGVAACVALIVAGLVWRAHCHVAELPGYYWLVFPVAGFDQLGVGALLALVHETGDEKLRRRFARWCLGLGAPLAVALTCIFERKAIGDIHYIYQPTVAALLFAWLTDIVARGVPGIAGWVLGHGATRLGGRVSYGMFAIHEFTAYALPPFLKPELAGPLDSGWRPVVLVVATCAIAWAAFHLIEMPIARLKTRFAT